MEDPARPSRRPLDPTERFAELLFGLIMVLTFTGTMSVTGTGRDEVRTMLAGALGCNLAWGIVDAVMYVLTTIATRGRGIVVLREVRRAAAPERAHGIIANALPEQVTGILTPGDLETLRRRLSALPPPRPRPRLEKDDLLGAAAVFLLVFFSTFPVAIPFVVLHDARLALRLSNAIALVLLFALGYSLGRHTGGRPWRLGVGMLVLGGVLVALTIALGG